MHGGPRNGMYDHDCGLTGRKSSGTSRCGVSGTAVCATVSLKADTADTGRPSWWLSSATNLT